MTIASVRDQFNTVLAAIASIKQVHDQVPDAAGKMPCTILSLESIETHATLTGSQTQSWRILLLLAKRGAKAAVDDLDPYLAPSGSDSMQAAIEGGTIGDDATLLTIENIGHLVYRDTTFIGAEFVVEVVETG